MAVKKLSIKQDVIARLLLAFSATYPPRGFDPVNLTLNNHPLVPRFPSPLTGFISHPLTLMTSFLGLPNHKLNIYDKQSLISILKNLMGWQDNVTSRRKVINGIKAPFALIWHVIAMIANLILNCVKLVTEFLPLTLAAFLDFASRRTNPNHFIERGMWRSAYYFFRSLYFVGRAVTSPTKGVRAAWKEGVKIGERWADKYRAEEQTTWRAGFIVGSLFVALSISVTGASLALLLPISIKMVAINVIPQALNYLPHLLSVLPMWVPTGLLYPSAYLGVMTGAIFVGLSKLKDKFSNWWQFTGQFVTPGEDKESKPERRSSYQLMLAQRVLPQRKTTINLSVPIAIPIPTRFPYPADAATSQKKYQDSTPEDTDRANLNSQPLYENDSSLQPNFSSQSYNKYV